MGHLPTIYASAVLLPLASFFFILIFANQLGRFAAWIATGAILVAGFLSFIGFGLWLRDHFPEPLHGGHAAAHGKEHPHGEHSDHREGTGGWGQGTGHKGQGAVIPDSRALTMVSLVQDPTGAKAAGERDTQPPTTATAK